MAIQCIQIGNPDQNAHEGPKADRIESIAELWAMTTTGFRIHNGRSASRQPGPGTADHILQKPSSTSLPLLVLSTTCRGKLRNTWGSPPLQLVVSSRHNDPRTGIVDYRLPRFPLADQATTGLHCGPDTRIYGHALDAPSHSSPGPASWVETWGTAAE